MRRAHSEKNRQCVVGGHKWCGRPAIGEVETRAYPLRQLQETHGGWGVVPYLPPEYAAASASVAVTAVTDLLFDTHLFGRRVIGLKGTLAGACRRI
jgi:hypothetical protein